MWPGVSRPLAMEGEGGDAGAGLHEPLGRDAIRIAGIIDQAEAANHEGNIPAPGDRQVVVRYVREPKECYFYARACVRACAKERFPPLL